MKPIRIPPHLACLLIALSAPSRFAAAQDTATIRGTVFDSTLMRPAVNAVVWSAGRSESATTDSAGRFEIRGARAARVVLQFSAPGLDSIGLSGLGISIETDVDRAVLLTTPSHHTLSRKLCKDAAIAESDSGIFWGIVRDAATDTRLSGSRVLAARSELVVGADKRVSMGEVVYETLTDSTGTFYMCGLPVGTELFVQALGTRSKSGVVAFSLGARRIFQSELLVSSEMVQLETADSSLARINTAKPSATVRGTVRELRGAPLADAVVKLVSSDSSVRTDAQGNFELRNVPAGTQQLEIKKIGWSTSQHWVQLRSSQATEARITLQTAQALAAVDVVADRIARRDRLEYDERRKAGFGYAIEAADIANRVDMLGVLQTLQSAKVTRRNGIIVIEPTVATMKSGNSCPEAVTTWIDGARTSLAEASALDPSVIRAIEWFPRVTTAPAKYVGLGSCPVILFWTVRSRW